jgi:anti-sigma factor RsiW
MMDEAESGGGYEKLRALLPWHVKGSLNASERAAMDSFLKTSAGARAEAAWLRQLDELMRAATPLPDEAPGFERFRQQLAAGRRVVPAPRRGFRWPQWFAPAFAVAATLVIVQTGVIVYLLTPGNDRLGTLSAPQPAASEGRLLQVTFKPQATEAQLRALLNTAGAEIVSGPGALGVYVIAVPTDRAEAARAVLAGRADLVESVTLAPR